MTQPNPEPAIMECHFKLGEVFSTRATFEFAVVTRYSCNFCDELYLNPHDHCFCREDAETRELEEVDCVICPVCDQYFSYQQTVFPIWGFLEHLETHLML